MPNNSPVQISVTIAHSSACWIHDAKSRVVRILIFYLCVKMRVPNNTEVEELRCQNGGHTLNEEKDWDISQLCKSQAKLSFFRQSTGPEGRGAVMLCSVVEACIPHPDGFVWSGEISIEVLVESLTKLLRVNKGLFLCTLHVTLLCICQIEDIPLVRGVRLSLFWNLTS